MPNDLQNEHDRPLAILLHVLSFIPDPSLPIAAILDFTRCPPIDSSVSLSMMHPEDLFSPLEPFSDLPDCFTKSPIPSCVICDTLLRSFGQVWLDGAKSICDPRFPASPLPFWFLSYWRDLAQLVELKSGWEMIWSWVAMQQMDLGLRTEIQQILCSMGWGVALQGPADRLIAYEFAEFLSSAAIKGCFIDAMINKIAERVT
ncbi:hypothetical protein PAXRUDRAFT_805385 [Paxillus rubicundulus Ve08.2h10]|uniref:Uncharacterized protein n=1 Tax=Paxillus rubicundulus Ve08.2h10 TaxID=930991 RepID=A0A0D0CHG8_9AGAM|nr:hypothetical protein PAXRUDRAFT_805385 [Paxillus rubicundulus Ve08.2h10]